MVEAELNPSKFGWELLSRIDLKNQLNPCSIVIGVSVVDLVYQLLILTAQEF